MGQAEATNWRHSWMREVLKHCKAFFDHIDGHGYGGMTIHDTPKGMVEIELSVSEAVQKGENDG